MLPWLMSAIGALRGLASSGLGAAGIGAGSGLAITALTGGFNADGSPRRRRRRRRTLTASDKADIAFIQGILGQKAGKDFAMIVAARR